MPGLPAPLRLDPAFTDPASVLACAREGAPYRLLSVVDRGYAAEHYPPWFRGYWVVPGKTFLPAAEALLHEPRLAEAALFFDHYRCRATAETTSTVSRIAKSTVLGMLEDDPGFSRTFVRALAGEVRELRTRLELRNIRPASERLLQYLRLRQDQGLPPYDRPLAAMAAELGLTPEALYRIASRLESAGKVRRQGGRLVLSN